MTRKQIEKRRNEIYHRVYKDDVRIGKEDQFTESEKVELNELSARDMINSVLIYDYPRNRKECWDTTERKMVPTGEHMLKYDRYIRKYAYDTTYKLCVGEERMKTLIEEQLKDFESALVGFSGYDSEDCSYNYCIWWDD